MISPSLPGVTITISINNNALPEHILPDLSQINSRTTDRLVEAQSKQIFTINLTADSSTNFLGQNLAFKILVDGRYIETPLISGDMVAMMNGPWTEISDGIHISKDWVRRYQFMDLVKVAENTTSLSSRSTSMRSAISRSYSSSAPTSGRPTPMTSMASAPRMSEAMLTPSMSASSDGEAMPPPPRPHYTERELSELGTIKVEVSHVDMSGGPMTFSGSVAGRLDFGPNRQQKPGLTQRVGFTAPEKTAAVSTFGTTKVAGVPNPAATFIFHYRAKEAIDAVLALPLDAIKEEEQEEGGVEVKKEAADSESDPTAEESAVPVKDEPISEDDGSKPQELPEPPHKE